MIHFQCDKCGICCRMLSGILQLKHFDCGDGICMHLKNNLCEIYDSRPEICNVEIMFKKYFSKEMNEEEYMAAMAEACIALKKYYANTKKANIPE